MTDARKTGLGWFLVATPIPLLFATLVGYAVVTFLITQSLETTTAPTISRTVAFTLGLGGLFGTLGVFLGMPIGIYLLASRVPKELESRHDKTSLQLQEFRSASAFAKTTIGLLIAFSVAASFDVIAQSAVLGYASSLASGIAVPTYSLIAYLGSARTAALILFALSAIGYLIWKHRTYHNLHVLHDQPPTYSRPWAVLGYFIPFVSLVIPFRVMREIIQGSKAEDAAQFLVVWWTTFLASQVVFNSIALGLKESSIPHTMIGAISNVLWDVSMVVSAVCLIIMIRTITKQQNHLAAHR